MYKPGEIVQCRITDCAKGGYTILLPDDLSAFLQSTKIWPIDKLINVAFVENDGQSMFFTDNLPRGDHGAQTMAELVGFGVRDPAVLDHPVIDSYFAGLAERCGVDVEQVRKMTFADVLEKANLIQMGIELSDLTGTFEQNLLAILQIWQHFTDAQMAGVQASKSLLSYLRNENLISQKQLETIEYGQSLVDAGLITFRQFAVGYRDEIDGALSFRQSLELRHWLPSEPLEASKQ